MLTSRPNFLEKTRPRDNDEIKTESGWGNVTLPSLSHSHEGFFGGTSKYMAVLVRDLDPCIDRAWASAGTVRPTSFIKACGCHCEDADDEYQNGRFLHHAAHGCDGGRTLTCLGRMQATHLVSRIQDMYDCAISTGTVKLCCLLAALECILSRAAKRKGKKGKQEGKKELPTEDPLSRQLLQRYRYSRRATRQFQYDITKLTPSVTDSSITRACSVESDPFFLVGETLVLRTIVMNTMLPASFAM